MATNSRRHIARTRVGEYFLSMLFVSFYGSGFVIGKYGIIDATPLSFLLLRFAVASTAFIGLSFLLCERKSLDPQRLARIAIPGCLGLFGFSSAAFIALDYGINPAMLSLIVAFQPLLVALVASLHLGEQVSVGSWVGLFVSFAGVVIFVTDRILVDSTLQLTVLLAVLAMLFLSLGNITQKALCHDMEIFWGGAIQNAASAGLCALIVPFAGGFVADPTFILLGSLFWMVAVVSIGAVSIMYFLIRIGDVSKVASLFFLMPVVALLLSAALFGDDLTLARILGITIACGGVFLFHWSSRKAKIAA